MLQFGGDQSTAYGMCVCLVLATVLSVTFAGSRSDTCVYDTACSLDLVESIPENLTYPRGSPAHLSTYSAWMTLLSATSSSLDVASYYWTLLGRGDTRDPTDWDGKIIFRELLDVAMRGVEIRIVQNAPSHTFPDNETRTLARAGAVVHSLNFTRLQGDGILHTKFWIVDRKHFYVGSANMDWRSLTQVKEMGVLGMNCECLAQDIEKIFAVYWNLSSPNARIPPSWSPAYDAMFNISHPANIRINGTPALAYWSSSPPSFSAHYRTDDLTALLHVIESAQHYISVAVMDYAPAFVYRYPNTFWPKVDDALRRAAFDRGVHVRFLGSLWNHTSPDLPRFLRSLADLSGTGSYGGIIEARLFIVPALTNRAIPYTRVNHNKYMVTDNAAYITTSNWSADYWEDTGGVSITVNQTGAAQPPSTLQYQLTAVFERDWDSQYSVDIEDYFSNSSNRH